MKITNYKLQITNFLLHPLFAGSMVMILGNNFVNLINYIYHLLMGRMLGPGNYGELAALLSLIGLIGMIPFSLGLVIIKFTSSAKTEKESSIFISWLNEKVILVSFVVTMFMIVTAPLTADFLNIRDKNLIILMGLSFLFSIPSFFNRSALQGLLRFKEMVSSIIIENFIKLFLGVVVIYLGFALFGVVAVFVCAAFFGWIISRKFINDHLVKVSETPANITPAFLYSIPVLIQSFSITSLYSADLILVKHFFPSFEAGLYASLSTLGKIIFFGAAPVTAAMFPIISKRQAKGENFQKIFIYSLFLTLGISGVVLIIYGLLPKLAISILFGSQYLQSANLLVWFGVFMTIFTLCTLFISYFLSLNRIKVVILPLIAALFQIIGINVFHDSLETVISISIGVVSLLLLSLIVYFFYANKTNFSNSSFIQAGAINRKRSAKDQGSFRPTKVSH